MEFIECFTCRDIGLPEGCPECGKKPDIVNKITPTNLFSDPTMVQIKWDENKLIETHLERKEDPFFIRYVSTLTALYKLAMKGTLPRKSLLIISDDKCGKHTFAYSMINALSSFKYSCCQVIDHQEYLRIAIIGSEKPYLPQKVTLDEIIYSDFLVMTIDTVNKYSASRAIRSILNKRGHAGKVTFILSNMSVSELEGKKDDLKGILWQEGLDELRYVNVLSC